MSKWWGSFDAYSSTPVIPQSKNWSTSKPWPSGCPRMAGGPPHPVWRYWFGENTFPWRISTEPTTTGKWGRKKQLPWLWLSRAAWSDLEHPQEYYVEPCRNSTNVFPPPGRRWSPEPRDTRHCQEVTCGSCFPYPRAWRGGTDYPTSPWGTLSFRARESFPFRGKTEPQQGRFPSIPLELAHLHANQTHAGLAGDIPLGAWLDLCFLGSLQVTTLHDPVAGEVRYVYQSQVITQVSLQLPLFEPSKPYDSPPRIQEFEWTQCSNCHPQVTWLLLNSLIPRKWLEMHCEFTQNGIGLQIK